MGIYVVFALRGEDFFSKFPSVPSGAKDFFTADVEAPPEAKPFAEYESVLKRRDLFDTSFVPVDFNNLQKAAPSADLPANLKVVGIILGATPEVIIEDTTNKQTYFLQKDRTENGISIQDITANEVTLTYQGQIKTIPVKRN